MKKLDEATKVFCSVRDAISPVDHPLAYRKMHFIPMAFYAVYSEAEAVKLLLDYDNGDERELGRAVVNSMAEVRAAFFEEDEEV